MTVRQIDVDLDVAPEKRWEAIAPLRDGALALMRYFVNELGGVAEAGGRLLGYHDAHVDPEHAAEMRGIAHVLGAPLEQVVLANLYYEALRLVPAPPAQHCTAFAVDSGSGPLHARNLDWPSDDGLLASQTLLVNFRRGGGPPLYRIVGWPGYIGCMTGVAPGRFSVTLNTVDSGDPFRPAMPVALRLRRVLETAPLFEIAVVTLREVRLATDCLLLLSGARARQLVVIERAPTRCAVRGPVGGVLVVTNHYQILAGAPSRSPEPEPSTSLPRYARALELVRTTRPSTPAACLSVLRDPGVMQPITAQHVVLSPTDGAVTVETTK
jgi:acid ceramidase/N-acylethanolamine-hydrolysing acid amidase